ncbi:dTDP-glucose 4,6-dehydratase [Bacillus gobiensis]|uniref:dTDP-glucose 4,6-dehydratase n=1 Tax=Bacillus gobiensis TaxID=1441095 RepID=UPI003D2291C5
MNILVTGGAGFIGSHFVKYMLSTYPGCLIVNYDSLTYAGNLETLREIEGNSKHIFVKGSINDSELLHETMRKHSIDIIVHFAAETHVDKSIQSSSRFTQTNIGGTQVLLDAALTFQVDRYIQISTDEVYGSLGDTGSFQETDPLLPNSPYSASKAGADLLARAYYKTYGLPIVITRCSNNYGSFQHPEKVIPLFITNALEKKRLPVYGSGKNVRDWIHVRDHCSAIDAVLHRGSLGETYNVGGSNERSNIELAELILYELGLPSSFIEFVADRPGHDYRYAIDSSKLINSLGWKPEISFTDGLKETITWYMQNEDWWKPLKPF